MITIDFNIQNNGEIISLIVSRSGRSIESISTANKGWWPAWNGMIRGIYSAGDTSGLPLNATEIRTR